MPLSHAPTRGRYSRIVGVTGLFPPHHGGRRDDEDGPPVMISPSSRVPEQGLDWFFVATKACGGGTSNLGLFWRVYVFIIYEVFMPYLQQFNMVLV